MATIRPYGYLTKYVNCLNMSLLRPVTRKRRRWSRRAAYCFKKFITISPFIIFYMKTKGPFQLPDILYSTSEFDAKGQVINHRHSNIWSTDSHFFIVKKKASRLESWNGSIRTHHVCVCMRIDIHFSFWIRFNNISFRFDYPSPCP